MADLFNKIKYFLYTPGDRVSWRDLTDEEQSLIPNSPGAGNFVVIIGIVFEHFGFEFGNYNFSQHDMYYVAGGNIIDKLKADILMLLYMLVDSFYQDSLWQGLLIFFIVAPLAFVLVSTVGLMFFTFGPYITKDEIIQTFTCTK